MMLLWKSPTLPERPPGSPATIFFLLFVHSCIILITHSSPTRQRHLGISYGPFRGVGPGAVNSTTVREDLNLIKDVLHANAIRSYGTAVGLENVAPIAQELGLDAWIGAWISDDGPNNVEEVVRACSQSDDVVIIGNEYVHFAPDKLAAIEFLKPYWAQAVSNGKRVAYAETSAIWSQFPQIVQFVDIALVHSYSFWDANLLCGNDLHNSSMMMEIAAIQTYNDFVQTRTALHNAGGGGDILVILGETGWPSSGCAFDNCTQTLQAAYFESLLQLWLQNEIPISLSEKEASSLFLFAAFDEPYKEEGTHCGADQFAKFWGLFSADRQIAKTAAGIVGNWFFLMRNSSSSSSKTMIVSSCWIFVLLLVSIVLYA